MVVFSKSCIYTEFYAMVYSFLATEENLHIETRRVSFSILFQI